MLRTFVSDPIAAVLLIIVLGSVLGRLAVRGVSLGSSGVLFVALAFGQLGWVEPEACKVLGQFGVVLFVYAIGLQAGPRFVGTVRSKGLAPLFVGLCTVVGAALGVALLGMLLGIGPELTVGIFAGALTSTPALAAATEASNSSLVSVAYGIAYPVGVIGVVVFVQVAPRWLASHPGRGDRQADAPASAPVLTRWFRAENPACIGCDLTGLKLHEMLTVNISRISRGGETLPFGKDVRLERDDLVMAVGTAVQLDRLALLIGRPVEGPSDRGTNVVARDVYITEAVFAGQPLRSLRIRNRYGVVITRVRRESLEFVPRGDFVLEVGDQVRVVGSEPKVKAFVQAAGVHEQRVHETGIPAFCVGLVLGLLLGFMPLPIPGVGPVKLGVAGGPLLVGLLFGHFGRIGRLRVHVPPAGRYLMRELGLVLFLVSAGTAAGSELLPVLREQGFALLILAVLTVVMAIGIGFASAHVMFRQSVPSTMGMVCGAMTSTPGLGLASAQFDSDVAALSYAAVYPLSLVLMTVVAQLLLTVVRAI